MLDGILDEIKNNEVMVGLWAGLMISHMGYMASILIKATIANKRNSKIDNGNRSSNNLLETNILPNEGERLYRRTVTQQVQQDMENSLNQDLAHNSSVSFYMHKNRIAT